jgi:hypothetical protein
MTEQKPGVVTWVEENFQDIECTFYSSIGLGAYGAAFGSVFTGQYWVTAGLIAIGGAAELAYNLGGCNGPPPPPPDTSKCWEYTGEENSSIEVFNPGTGDISDDNNWNRLGPAKRITSVQRGVSDAESSFILVTRINCVLADGSARDYQFRDEYEWRLTAPEGETCKTPGLPRPADDTPIGPPITYTDDQCIWTITPMDAYVDDEGFWHTYFVITSNNPTICGGPYGYWSSRRGPQWDEPDTPFPPTPEPPTACKAGPAGPPGPQGPQGPKGDPGEGGCSCDAIRDLLDPLDKKLDQILENLTPCKPILEGQWVTTRWISDEKMVDSNRRLRKLFRYRTKSSRDLGQLSAYWEQFSWRAGSVCVRHTGAWWGDPQVWAESPEEGKRVIRHAATEAGLNPDQIGQWAVSSSRSPRYGMSGTMKVLRHLDFPWVASRDGSNWPNTLAKKRDP